jgi:hypothetical protein
VGTLFSKDAQKAAHAKFIIAVFTLAHVILQLSYWFAHDHSDLWTIILFFSHLLAHILRLKNFSTKRRKPTGGSSDSEDSGKCYSSHAISSPVYP